MEQEVTLAPLLRVFEFFSDSGGITARSVAYLPESYYRDREAPLPLLLFLHGWGAVGADDGSQLDRVITGDGIFALVDEGRAGVDDDERFIILGPQCTSPTFSCWAWQATTLVDEALDDAITRLPVDLSRVYVTGLSTGGEGSFIYASARPDRVAAALPIASTWSASTEGQICQMSSVPVWTFHSSLDTLQSPQNSIDLINAYNACEPSPPLSGQLDLYPWENGGNNHMGWVEVYSGDHSFENSGFASVYDWMLSFSL